MAAQYYKQRASVKKGEETRWRRRSQAFLGASNVFSHSRRTGLGSGLNHERLLNLPKEDLVKDGLLEDLEVLVVEKQEFKSDIRIFDVPFETSKCLKLCFNLTQHCR